MQLQGAKQRFEAQGIKLAAISYDSPAILKDFADRHKIEYPLLADPQSKIIASYGALNPEATGMMKGMALPGYFYMGTNGVIREQYFEAKYMRTVSPQTMSWRSYFLSLLKRSAKRSRPHILDYS